MDYINGEQIRNILEKLRTSISNPEFRSFLKRQCDTKCNDARTVYNSKFVRNYNDPISTFYLTILGSIWLQLNSLGSYDNDCIIELRVRLIYNRPVSFLVMHTTQMKHNIEDFAYYDAVTKIAKELKSFYKNLDETVVVDMRINEVLPIGSHYTIGIDPCQQTDLDKAKKEISEYLACNKLANIIGNVHSYAYEKAAIILSHYCTHDMSFTDAVNQLAKYYKCKVSESIPTKSTFPQLGKPIKTINYVDVFLTKGISTQLGKSIENVKRHLDNAETTLNLKEKTIHVDVHKSDINIIKVQTIKL